MGDFCKKVLFLLIPICCFTSVAAKQTTANNSNGIGGRSTGAPLPVRFTVTDLGGLFGSQSAQATAINDAGQIVGKSGNHAFLWEQGKMTDLGTLGGQTSSANAINDRGQIVGESETADGETHAFLWEHNSMVDLGSPGETSSAHGINNRGIIVGAAFAKNIRGGAVIWQDGKRQSLGDLGPSGSGSTAMSINNGGEIAGVSSGFAPNGGGVVRGVVWLNGAIRDIGTLGGLHSTANSLNGTGDVVGWAELPDQASTAFIWSDGAMHQLGILQNGLVAPGNGTQAIAINDYGQVVGSSLNSTGESRAVVWENGKITDLNDQIAAKNGLVLTRATAINNRGQIVVEEEASDLAPKSYLLAP
jgi:probable HAF family extracellular repeat protein